MATNPYFQQGARSEQILYEDLIIESLKFYGQDVYYMPREMVNVDDIFKDDEASRFDDAYKIEMYIENVEGFDGEGDLFTKFGVEIRDQATFVVSRKRWQQLVGAYENDPSNEYKQYYRPHEGDLIHLPLSNSIFQIMKVYDESPFYQLKDLPVFRLTCELFEYSGEDFDTGIDEIDAVEKFGYKYVLTFNNVTPGAFEMGENITQLSNDGTYTMSGDIVDIDNSGTNTVVKVVNVGATDGLFHSFAVGGQGVIGATSEAVGTLITVSEEIENTPNEFQNDEFETVADDIIDFSESNPFGDP